MHVHKLYTQHQATGAAGRTLEGITSLVKLRGYNRCRAAIAYATLNGCKILAQNARAFSRWIRCKKQWLISIDFGRTEPAALEFLAKLPNAEVRIPNGAQVIARRAFSPVLPFHPKVYAVDDIADGRGHVFGVFLGSGNLTGSGLLTGSESGVLSYWTDPSHSQRKDMMSAYDHMLWFDAAWERSDPLANIISTYKKRRKKLRPAFIDDDQKIVELYVGSNNDVVAGDTALDLNGARALWVKVGTLYKNRGPGKPGNQIDLPRGTRVFFGFSARAVERNTVIGQVFLKNKGFKRVKCSVRYGNNQMDKVNLPVPGTEGPKRYDDSILLFERAGFARDGTPKFQIYIGKEADLKKWKMRSMSVTDLRMQSGRPYGLLH